MKKKSQLQQKDTLTKKGYNEKNPGQPQGAFAPASSHENAAKETIKSNTADKKQKEEESQPSVTTKGVNQHVKKV